MIFTWYRFLRLDVFIQPLLLLSSHAYCGPYGNSTTLDFVRVFYLIYITQLQEIYSFYILIYRTEKYINTMSRDFTLTL